MLLHPCESDRAAEDYQEMREMQLPEPASFDEILTTLEARINGVAI